MSQFDNLRDKATELADQHPDKVEQASDAAGQKGGDAFDKATGDKFADHTDKAQQALDDRIGNE